MEFFLATEAHTPALAQFVNSAYRGESSRKGWTTEADYLDGQRTSAAQLNETLRTPGQEILVMSADDAWLGCVFLEMRPTSGTGYLGMLTVNPEIQAKGIGSQLLAAAEKHLGAKGARRIELQVIHLRDSLMAWYERRGYRRTGETRPFPYGRPELGLPKVEGLHFIVFAKDLETA